MGAPRDPAPARRWFQFRLGTLLLLPLILVLMQRLASTEPGAILTLGLILGAIFGSLWAVGRMRIVGLKHSGLRRITPVLWAAVGGGVTAGMLAGPCMIWIALLRGSWWWLYDYGPGGQHIELLHAINELATSGLFGGLLGAILGVWGALIVGPAWAYIAFAPRWSRRSVTGPVAPPFDESRLKLATRCSARSRRARFARGLVVATYAVGLFGFPAYLVWNASWATRDTMVARGLARDWQTCRVHWKSVAPRWPDRDFPFSFAGVSRRIESVTLSGNINDPKILDSLDRFENVYLADLQFESTDAELAVLGEKLRRFGPPRFPPTTIILSGTAFSASGVAALVNTCACNVVISDPRHGEEVIEGLAASDPSGSQVFRTVRRAELTVDWHAWMKGRCSVSYRHEWVPPAVVIPSYLPLW